MVVYEKALEHVKKGETVAIAHLVERKGSAPRGSGAKMLVIKDGTIFGTVGGGRLEAFVIKEALDAIEKKQHKNITYNLDKEAGDSLYMQLGGQVQLYVEVLAPKHNLVIVGAGHVGRILAHFAKELEWDIWIADDRKELLESGHLPEEVRSIWGSTYQEALKKVALNTNTSVVIVTRDVDAQVLEEVIQAPVRYIGMIGSRRKIALIFENLKKKGISEERLSAVHAPIGLNIGAETPAEIAVCILAELIAVIKGKENFEYKAGFDKS